MKNLILILKNLKTFIKRRTVFMSVFVCGQIVAVITILIATGIAQMSFNENTDTNTYMSGVEFEVNFDGSGVEMNAEQWRDGINKISRYMGDKLETVNMVSWTKGDKASQVLTYMYTDRKRYETTVMGNEDFTYDELMGDEHLIIMKNSMEKIKPGEMTEFDGENYRVKGCQNVIYPIVPVGAVPTQNIVYSTGIYTVDMITKGRAEQIKSELYKVFGKDIKIDVISAKDLVNLQADNTGKYAVVIASVIILLNSFVCYRYILEYRKKWLGIVRIVGCSVKRAFVIYEGELMIMLLFCATTGTLIFERLIYPVMCNKSEMYEEIYNMSTYGFAILLYMITAFLIITVCVLPMISKSIIKLKNRE